MRRSFFHSRSTFVACLSSRCLKSALEKTEVTATSGGNGPAPRPFWRRKFSLFLFFIVVPSPPLVATGVAEPFRAASPPAMPPEKIVLQLKWSHQFQFAGYYAALEKGFYKEVGLDVELREGKSLNRAEISDLVTRREAHFGIANVSLIADRARGKPVVLLATIFQHSPLVLIARTDMTSSLSPAELARHEIMMEPDDMEIFSYFHSAGIPPSRLRLIRHSRNKEDLLTGKVAVMTAYVTDWIPSIKGRNTDLALISARSAGLDFFGDNLFTSEAEIRDHPKRVRLFREASLKGWEYALAHPEEIIELILAQYPTQRSREELLFEAHQIRQHIHPELIPLGTMNAQRWETIVTTLEETGLLTNGQAALNGFLYDGFIENNPRLLYWLSGSAGVVLLAALVWGLPLVRLNRRLTREIAERRRAEELATTALEAAGEANRARDRFITTVTHEIRTPLNIIVGYARTLAASPELLPPEKRSAINAINESGQHLLQLVENILDLSKIEAGRAELAPTDFDLSALLQSLKTIFQGTCQRKGIDFELAWQVQRPLWVCGDEGKLRQVLFNLLGNAVKFTQNGKVTLCVTPETEEYYLFEVVDHGLGIDEIEIRTIFEPFHQTTEGARHGGTGLGLPISLHLMQMMGSHINVQSIKGKGSRFFFSVRLPPAQEAAPVPSEPLAVKEVPLADGCRVRALVVDDVEMNRTILAHILESLGCEIKSAATGEEAVELARKEGFDIAFIDMRMQTMGGVETARHLRELADGRPLRLVCFSAAMVGGQKGDEQAVGFDDFLAKPFRRERVRECLEALPGVRFSGGQRGLTSKPQEQQNL